MNHFLTGFANELTKLAMFGPGSYPKEHTAGMMAQMGSGKGMSQSPYRDELVARRGEARQQKQRDALYARRDEVRQQKRRDALYARRGQVRQGAALSGEPRVQQLQSQIRQERGPSKPWGTPRRSMTLADMRQARSGTPSGPARTGPAVQKITSMPPMEVDVGDVRRRVLGPKPPRTVAHNTQATPRRKQPVPIPRR